MRTAHYFRVGRSRGFLLADALTGLIILSTLGVVLFTAVGRQRHASQSLAGSRAALRLAESAVTSLQLGHSPQLPAEARVKIVALPTAAIAGHHWVSVAVTQDRHTAALTALVPDSSQGGGRP